VPVLRTTGTALFLLFVQRLILSPLSRSATQLAVFTHSERLGFRFCTSTKATKRGKIIAKLLVHFHRVQNNLIGLGLSTEKWNFYIPRTEQKAPLFWIQGGCEDRNGIFMA
jgi:hypothetical protein